MAKGYFLYSSGSGVKREKKGRELVAPAAHASYKVPRSVKYSEFMYIRDSNSINKDLKVTCQI
jgi:hypothetical protein